jgi:hypothetical protein
VAQKRGDPGGGTFDPYRVGKVGLVYSFMICDPYRVTIFLCDG